MQSNAPDEFRTPENSDLTGDLDGTKPITDRDSKMIMLRGERGDVVITENIVKRFINNETVPDKLRIIRRTGTFYGTELLLEDPDSKINTKYLLTAPGPDSFLYLWKSEIDDDGFRIGWSKLAELKASFADDLPQYSICNTCGEPIKSLEHERLAEIDECESLSD